MLAGVSMTNPNPKKRSFYGWGFEEDVVSAEELSWFERAWSNLFGVDGFNPAPVPRESEITLRAPRVSLPTALKQFSTSDKYDRLLHCYGRSVHDLARMIHRRDFSNPPDAVAYPRDETEIRAVLDWCGANNFAAIPYGGGSSDLDSATRTLQKIRYKDGQIGYATRNHFTELDWVPHNVRAGYLRDITSEVAGQDAVEMSKTVSKREWYLSKSTVSFGGQFSEEEKQRLLPKLQANDLGRDLGPSR